DIESGKTLIIKYLTISEARADGYRTVYFELNGQPRDVAIIDKSLTAAIPTRKKADVEDPHQIGASMPGMVVQVAVSVGDEVKRGQKLLTLEAMKMETNITAERDLVICAIHVFPGTQVDTGDLLIELE